MSAKSLKLIVLGKNVRSAKLQKLKRRLRVSLKKLKNVKQRASKPSKKQKRPANLQKLIPPLRRKLSGPKPKRNA